MGQNQSKGFYPGVTFTRIEEKMKSKIDLNVLFDK